jgi:hypothetical protein
MGLVTALAFFLRAFVVSRATLAAENLALRQQLSLSRLNHRLPRGQAHPEVVQGTAEFHH